MRELPGAQDIEGEVCVVISGRKSTVLLNTQVSTHNTQLSQARETRFFLFYGVTLGECDLL